MRVRMADGTGDRNYKWVRKQKTRHGKVNYYLRRGDLCVRLRSEPGTPEFDAEYYAALEHKPAPVTVKSDPMPHGSFRWLVVQYKKSSNWLDLDPKTQRMRALVFDHICEVIGTEPFKYIEPRHVMALRDAKADKPHAARHRVKFLRGLFNWAIEAGHMESNPAREVKTPTPKSKGIYTWTLEDIEAFDATHPLGTKPRLAKDLLLFTGVRRSDVVRLGRQMERQGIIHFTEAKGAKRNPKERQLPILPILRQSIDSCPSGHMTYLVTEYGKPFSEKGFGGWFRKQCDAAGLKQCSAHGLRKAGATIAAENGATANELMAVFGWTNIQEAELYTRAADRKRLAQQSIHKVQPGEIVTPFEGVAQGVTKKGKKA